MADQQPTVDVHQCISSSCHICRRSRSEVSFVQAMALEDKMIGKLRTTPGRWWELGESFVDLYQQANRA